MSAKIQSMQDRGNQKAISKKISCLQHRQKYIFKCLYPSCQSPFICSSVQCIDNHLHEQKITMCKFSTDLIASKFYQVDNLITDDTIYQNAKTLKNYIDGLKESIKNVYIGIKQINQNYDYLKGDIEGPLSIDYINKVQQNFSLNQNVRKDIQDLKEKVKLQFPVKDSYFSFRNSLVQFLTQNIPGFSWSRSKEIYSSKSDLISCQKFHEKLAGLTDLVFIFVGDSKVIGSYYAVQYPHLAQKSKKDLKSFLFLAEKQQDSYQYYKFQPIQNCEQHITISQKTYICHGNTVSYGNGIRTVQRNFENINYCLPTDTYKSTQSHQTVNGTVRVKRFMILQAFKEKNYRIAEDQQNGEVNNHNQLSNGHSQTKSP